MRQERQCTAKTRSGNRCKGPAILGGTVCRMHGGSAPQVKAAAAERLKALQDPAITAMEHLLEHGKEETRLRASVAVLDRTGLGPHSTVNVEGSLGERLAELDRAGAVDSD